MNKAKLISWISQQIESLPSGTLFATDADIARMWGVSTRTVNRAMASFAADGLVTRKQGVGTFVGARAAPAELAAKVHQCAADHVANLLLGMIADGTLRAGQFMPSVKFLRLSLKASEHTIAGALRGLAQRELITRAGRSYMIGPREALFQQPHHKTIAFIQQDDTPLEGFFSDRFLGPSFQKMEKELRAAGCNLTFHYAREVADCMRLWLSPVNTIFGLVFCRADNRELAMVADITSQAQRKELSVPRILLDMKVSSPRNLPNCYFVNRGNLRTAAARLVGGFIDRKRYTSFALMIDAKSAYALDYFWGNQKFLWEARRYADIPVRQFIRIPANLAERDVRAAIDRDGDGYYREYLEKKYGAAFDERFWSTVSFYTDQKTLPLPVHNELWIVPEAQGSVSLLATFAARGIRCPDSYSLLCLDDNPLQYHHGLSVCILDWEKAGYLMAHALIGDMPVKKSHQGYLSMGWDIIERKTT